MHASTAAVYAALDERRAADGAGSNHRGAVAAGRDQRDAVGAGRDDRDAASAPEPPAYRPLLDERWMGNDLAAPAASLHPEIDNVRRRVVAMGGRPVQVSGSGAASFGVFDGRRAASRAAARLRGEHVWAVAAVSVSAVQHRTGLFGAQEAAAGAPAGTQA